MHNRPWQQDGATDGRHRRSGLNRGGYAPLRNVGGGSGGGSSSSLLPLQAPQQATPPTSPPDEVDNHHNNNNSNGQNLHHHRRLSSSRSHYIEDDDDDGGGGSSGEFRRTLSSNDSQSYQQHQRQRQQHKQHQQQQQRNRMAISPTPTPSNGPTSSSTSVQHYQQASTSSRSAGNSKKNLMLQQQKHHQQREQQNTTTATAATASNQRQYHAPHTVATDDSNSWHKRPPTKHDWTTGGGGQQQQQSLSSASLFPSDPFDPATNSNASGSSNIGMSGSGSGHRRTAIRQQEQQKQHTSNMYHLSPRSASTPTSLGITTTNRRSLRSPVSSGSGGNNKNNGSRMIGTSSSFLQPELNDSDVVSVGSRGSTSSAILPPPRDSRHPHRRSLSNQSSARSLGEEQQQQQQRLPQQHQHQNHNQYLQWPPSTAIDLTNVDDMPGGGHYHQPTSASSSSWQQQRSSRGVGVGGGSRSRGSSPTTASNTKLGVRSSGSNSSNTSRRGSVPHQEQQPQQQQQRRYSTTTATQRQQQQQHQQYPPSPTTAAGQQVGHHQVIAAAPASAPNNYHRPTVPRKAMTSSSAAGNNTAVGSTVTSSSKHGAVLVGGSEEYISPSSSSASKELRARRLRHEQQRPAQQQQQKQSSHDQQPFGIGPLPLYNGGDDNNNSNNSNTANPSSGDWSYGSRSSVEEPTAASSVSASDAPTPTRGNRTTSGVRGATGVLDRPKNHFVAHSPAVEKYLSRSKLIEGVKAQNGGGGESVAGPGVPQPPATTTTSPRTAWKADRASAGPSKSQQQQQQQQYDGGGSISAGRPPSPRTSSSSRSTSGDDRMAASSHLSSRPSVPRPMRPQSTTASAAAAGTTSSTHSSHQQQRPTFVDGSGSNSFDSGMANDDRQWRQHQHSNNNPSSSTISPRNAGSQGATGGVVSGVGSQRIGNNIRLDSPSTSKRPPVAPPKMSSAYVEQAPVTNSSAHQRRTAPLVSPVGGPNNEDAPMNSKSRSQTGIRPSPPSLEDSIKKLPVTPDSQATNEKVDQFLASRNAQKLAAAAAAAAAAATATSEGSNPQQRSDDGSDRRCLSTQSTFAETSEDSSGGASEDSDQSAAMDDDESSCDDDSAEEWSVRVCVVSAVEFPASVVPKLPFSPVVKVGLVKLPKDDDGNLSNGSKVTDAERQRALAAKVEADGLMSVPRARIRCTSSKILSKRDTGSVEFHEEMRWDRVRDPREIALALELTSRAVLAPANIRESPPAQKVDPLQLGSVGGISKGAGVRTPTEGGVGVGGGGPSSIKSLFRRKKSDAVSEMETANAAAAVAKLLVEGGDESKTQDSATADESTSDGGGGNNGGSTSSDLKATTPGLKMLGGNQSEMNVKLRRRKRRRKNAMTEELRLGSLVVPLGRLPLEKAMATKETARIEEWFELESSHDPKSSSSPPRTSLAMSSTTAKRNPSILLEISFSTSEAFDESEDDMDEADGDEVGGDATRLRASYSKRASMKIRNQLKKEVAPVEEKIDEPVLQPGIVDFACVVGARDIGDQKADDGASGWVNSTPECCILERFPPSDQFHEKNGRSVILPNKVEWFCFPEGVKLWRGFTPPNADELKLKRFSASSPANIATSTALFDACLGCTTSFVWFVIASNSEEYGSLTVKTYGAVIRFFVPAPIGIDSTQDDFAQTMMGTPSVESADLPEKKRLWVPVGICLTSNLPIIGTMETMLLRLCERIAANGILSDVADRRSAYEDLSRLIINFQAPIPGVVHCSFPFLDGERLNIALPPKKGLPVLPHGNAVASVCRLLGVDGLNFLLAAFLTECKILLHSDDVANLSLVAEVLTALLYPFQWSLPYIPVLPADMMEFVEAPLSFLVGIPSSNMSCIDPLVLEDIVVVDLDRDFSTSDFFEGKRTATTTKTPTPLPAAFTSNISKAVYRLLREEDDVEESFGAPTFSARLFPRMESESLPERMFRLSVAIEVCSLIRGFQDCLVFTSTSQPIFNVDKFLQSAPAIYEDQRKTNAPGMASGQRVISPRSRRFVSLLVSCQHFYQFLETLDSERNAFFREVMGVVNATAGAREPSLAGRLLSLDNDRTIGELSICLQKLEDKTPVFHVKHETSKTTKLTPVGVFPRDLLQQIAISGKADRKTGPSERSEGVKQVSLEYLVELEKNPWRYRLLFDVTSGDSEHAPSTLPIEKVALRDAIGERRYRAWKKAITSDKFDHDEVSILSDDFKGAALDLTTLVTSAADDIASANAGADDVDGSHSGRDHISSAQRRIADAKDRDVLRRCLERARVSGDSTEEPFVDDKGRDLVLEAEAALRNESARRFLLNILSKRMQSDGQSNDGAAVSRLDPSAFEVLIRLGCAMLDACMEIKEYNSAYSLLKLTAGLYTTSTDKENDVSLVYMTGRIGLHPIYADLGVWEQVKDEHISARQETAIEEKISSEDMVEEEYEAAVATLYEMLGYGIPAEELARFASRISEKNGWFQSERGQTLLMLARRLCVRREQGEGSGSPSKKSDLELISPSPLQRATAAEDTPTGGSSVDLGSLTEKDGVWVETGWCHPAAQSYRRQAPNTPGTLSAAEEQKLTTKRANYMKRSAVTSMTYLGSSVVVTGGLDGGVFLARKTVRADDSSSISEGEEACGVRGVHLDWGSSGSRYAVGAASTALDGEFGVGAVTCLAATRGTHQSYKALASREGSPLRDTVTPLDDEDLLRAMEGCRVVAGTTCGDLRVWSIKDVFSAVFYANMTGNMSSQDVKISQRGGDGASSNFMSGRRKGTTDYAAGSSLTRLKFSLRGRALSGHRGGVSCIDVPSNVYRPDSIVSGGADGLIKLWSLRSPGAPTGRRGESGIDGSILSSADGSSPRSKTSRSGDALSILSGHGGRILCVKTAWHGDRLLSGGADRTVRVWDLAGSGGKCLNSLSGHFGWVTSVQYWGPNTIISASTDRSIALWDARVRNSPLFTLRHHYAPVSDVLVGSRTDPIMISGASDGTIAAWDFRHLSGSESGGEGKVRRCKVVRRPAAKLYMHDFSRSRHVFGPILLSKGTLPDRKTALCVGSDAVLHEWDVASGDIVMNHLTGHCDTVSCLASLQGDRLLDTQLEAAEAGSATGTISASWDGTVRMRHLTRRST